MSGKTMKKRKPKVIYYAAPVKNRASYFFASFFLTLAVSLFAAGFVIADRNSQRLGWGQEIEVFAVTGDNSKINFTLMGNSFTVDAVYADYAKTVLSKVKIAYASFEPEPLQFAEIAGRRLYSLEQKLLSYCSFIPK